jgi:hypothetical protein
MTPEMICYGYRYDCDGKYGSAVRLESRDAVIDFIRENIDSPQLVITDNLDRQLLLMRDGVDLFNDLDQIGISLMAVLNQVRDEMVEEGSQPGEKPEWERLYDQIGLSPGEIRMRQRVKAACRAARTVGDVAELIRGTYFDAHFHSSDGERWYRYFDEGDYAASLMVKDKNGVWQEEAERVILVPGMKVRHLRSSEDVHTFEILDSEEKWSLGWLKS